ncbi:ferritin-like domain-containing protein [Paracoccus laeviglucosivorans]|uniref:Ferritin-like metal-binding protein YciE n=1 Tax=Paracoccus laeviglucosivorans TaxID=1197861 RepID=A0A521FQ34_9RHOB|nr:ferritin-like domain-containing protein [Paracoccus laeviglucosivorans]SMO98347.1 Ferritin-like metal-binding protein YciE [Paracoccus laeviglucosivorans]
MSTNSTAAQSGEAKKSATTTRKKAREEGKSTTKATGATRTKRSQAVAKRTAARRSQKEQKSLSDLLEHALKDIYYAEKKIYRALPKMIKKADHPDLKEALQHHREETAGQIETLETVFEVMGKRARGEKCEAIDGILEEGESLLEDFGDSVAADAAIIFSCQAVEHYEITRYGSIRAFADALGLDEVLDHIDSILEQEKAADQKLNDLAESSVNDAAAEYDDDDEGAAA